MDVIFAWTVFLLSVYLLSCAIGLAYIADLLTTRTGIDRGTTTLIGAILVLSSVPLLLCYGKPILSSVLGV